MTISAPNPESVDPYFVCGAIVVPPGRTAAKILKR